MAREKFLSLKTGQMVYLKSDSIKTDRMVTRIIVNIDDSIQFELSMGDASSWHYSQEIGVKEQLNPKIGFKIPNKKKPARGIIKQRQNERSNKQGRSPRKTK